LLSLEGKCESLDVKWSEMLTKNQLDQERLSYGMAHLLNFSPCLLILHQLDGN
jgi:hypothetical protein